MKPLLAFFFLLASCFLLVAQEPIDRRLNSSEQLFQKLVSQQAAPIWFQVEKIDTLPRLDALLSRNDIGADLKSPALMQAATVGDAELVNLLIRWGTNVNYRRARDGQTILMVAAIHGFSVQCGNDPLVYSYPGNTEIVQALLNAGAHLDDQDDSGNTALMLAAENGRSGSVELLLNSGASANLRNKERSTALISAVSNGRGSNIKEIVAALIANGAELNARGDQGKTALSYAAGNTAIREMLIRAGAIE